MANVMLVLMCTFYSMQHSQYETGVHYGATSAFIFESHNGNLQKLFHGTQAVTEQIANSFSLFQSIPRLLSTVYDKSVKKTSTDFVDRMVRGYRLATNCVNKDKHNLSGLTNSKNANT